MDLGQSLRLDFRHLGRDLQLLWHQLSIQGNGLGKAADVLASTDVIDRQEVKDLVPFNHLRNSRADSGMNYWTNSGFEVDAENGVSGTASFKAEGVLGMTKSLTQTVYPASRRSYTFSAQIASEDLQKGPSGQVGIEVTFEYEDGSTETRFIDLF